MRAKSHQRFLTISSDHKERNRGSTGRGRFLPLLARIARQRQGKIMNEDKWIVGEAQLGTRAGVKLLRGPAHHQEARVEVNGSGENY